MMAVFSRISAAVSSAFFSTRDLVTSKLGVSALVFTSLYTIAAIFIDPLYIVELGNALVFGFAVVNLCLYLPDAIWSAKNDKGEAGQYFIVGLSLILLYLVELRAYSTIWRWLDYPQGWSTHPFHSFFLYICFFGLTMMMTAPGMTKGRIPSKNWRAVAIGVTLAVFFAGITVGLLLSGQTHAIRMPARGDYVVAQCPSDNPVKGNINRGQYIYHLPDSDYYQMTKPVVCFANEEDAIANGFRAPRERTTIQPPQNP